MKLLKDAAFIWTMIVGVSSGVVTFLYQQHIFLLEHMIDIGLLALTLITTAILYFLFTQLNKAVIAGFNQISENQLRSDVDRFFKAHKDDKFLTEDEAKYLHNLKDKVEALGINSYTLRQIQHLSKIPIK